jgi:hypothetical protein
MSKTSKSKKFDPVYNDLWDETKKSLAGFTPKAVEWTDQWGLHGNQKRGKKYPALQITKTSAVSIKVMFVPGVSDITADNEDDEIRVIASYKLATGGHSPYDDQGNWVNRHVINDPSEVLRLVKKIYDEAKEVATAPKEAKPEKFKQIAELDTVDLMAEFLAPLIILKFRTYIYSNKEASNPDSKIQVRCDLWFNRELHQQQYIVPDGKKLPQGILDYPRKYHARVEVNIDTKELTITENDLREVKITGIMNLDDIVQRICKSISGLKEKA